MKPLHPLAIPRYYGSKETQEPGYLARRFKAIRREQEAEAAKQAEKVQPIIRKKGSA